SSFPSVTRPYSTPISYANTIGGVPIRSYFDSLHVLNIFNGGKCYMFGCSYTLGYYNTENKCWVSNLSGFSGWTCWNFGVSGNKIIDELQRFRSNEPGFGILPCNLRGTMIWIGNEGNE